MTQLDRSDEIVAAWHLPAWVHRVPRAAWLFVALAALDVTVRASMVLPQVFPPDAGRYFWIVVRLLDAGLLVLLPAAVLAGPSAGPARHALFYGTGALAAAELLSLVLERLPFPDRDPLAASPNFLPVALQATILELAILGPVAMAVGLRWSSQDRSTVRSRPARATLALAVAATAVELATIAYGVLTRPADDLVSTSMAATDVALAVLAAFGTVAWGTLAAVAIGGRRPGRGWTLLLVAALAVFATRVAGIALMLATIPLGGIEGDPLRALFFWAFDLSSFVAVVGFGLLVVALTMVPRDAAGSSGDARTA